jgi:hypothetical protein
VTRACADRRYQVDTSSGAGWSHWSGYRSPRPRRTLTPSGDGSKGRRADETRSLSFGAWAESQIAFSNR